MFTHRGQLITNNTYSNPRNPTEEAETNYFTTGWKSVLFQVRGALPSHEWNFEKHRNKNELKNKQTHYIHCTMEYLNKKTWEIRLPCGTKSLQNKYFTQCVLAVINVFQINNKSLFSDKNGENVALSLSGVKSFSLSSLLTMWVFVTNCRFEEFTRLQDMHEGSTVNWERNDQINSRW